jgi:peptidoglycan/LPS O-acetylase OafA/YrhL
LWHFGVVWSKVYIQTETRLDVLMFGSLLAYLLHTGWRPRPWAARCVYPALAFLLCVVFFAHRDDGWLYYGGYTVVALACTVVVFAALDARSLIGRVLAWAPARVVGLRAYSLYLWHVLVFEAVERAWPGRSSFERLAAGLVITVVASEFSYRFVERPFLALKARKTVPPATSPGPLQGGPS